MWMIEMSLNLSDIPYGELSMWHCGQCRAESRDMHHMVWVNGGEKGSKWYVLYPYIHHTLSLLGWSAPCLLQALCQEHLGAWSVSPLEDKLTNSLCYSSLPDQNDSDCTLFVLNSEWICFLKTIEENPAYDGDFQQVLCCYPRYTSLEVK